MAISPNDRKAAERKRKKDAGYKEITFSLSPSAVDRLKIVASAYGETQAAVLERALAAMYSELSDENILEHLKTTDDQRPVDVARYLLTVCSCDERKARELYLTYLKQKHPGFAMSRTDGENAKIESRYRGVVNQLRFITKKTVNGTSCGNGNIPDE